MRLTEDATLATLEFDSYTEALEYAFEHRQKARNASSYGACNSDVIFSGTRTYEEAHKLATTGWKEGTNRVFAFREKLDVTGEVEREVTMFDVYGEGGVDMGRYFAGDPECMISVRKVKDKIKSPRQVKISVNVSCQADIDEETIFRRGAGVIALVAALEAAKVRVELEAVRINSGYMSSSSFIRMPLKRANQSLQTDKVAFALCHRSSNRRIGFSLTKMAGAIGSNIAEGGYGGESTYKPTDSHVFLGRLNHGTQFDNDAQTIAWIKAELVKCGVKLKNKR